MYAVTSVFSRYPPDNCNETMGIHPCMDGTCYEEEQRCDGVRQCRDGQDEMGCKFARPSYLDLVDIM